MREIFQSYIALGGILVGIVPNPALKAEGDIIINLGSTGVMLTVQIPRFALDAKNAQGQDIPFEVTLDGHGIAGNKSTAQILTES